MSEWDPNAFLRSVAEEVARVSEPPRDRTRHKPNGLDDKPAGVSLDDFHAYMPMHSYIFVPSREMWPASSINQRN
jgi:hypothetical protein